MPTILTDGDLRKIQFELDRMEAEIEAIRNIVFEKNSSYYRNIRVAMQLKEEGYD